MKKFTALLLGSVMLIAAVSGITACASDDDGTNGKNSGTHELGRITNGPEKKDFVAPARTDDRAADAYEAYDRQNAKIGSYSTLSAAIRAAVASDATYFGEATTPIATEGGYVKKKNGTRKLFTSRKGYAEASDDQFWYHENGASLAAYDCWNATESIQLITNTKLIVSELQNHGMDAVQGWNGYGFLDEYGEEIPSTAEIAQAQSWELSKTMDAAVQVFPARKKGVAGLQYKLDLSQVKIVPNYAGTDPVYAFFGFHAWEDYYVISVGLACDVTTGNWYAFEGSSRNDSFNDVTYNKGECVMTSTWVDDAGGGYFVPDNKEVSMSIQTKRMVDEIDGNEETYWVDDLVIELKDGAKYERRLTDSLINNYFPGSPLTPNNGFVFIAGLDIKNNSQAVSKADIADYFNGAQFLNLAVTEAKVYFPTTEEITDIEYTVGSIDSSLRGQWHDLLLANDEATPGTYDYTILNTYASSSYTKRDGKDYYSFDYAKSPVSADEISGKLKTYQDKIDLLKGINGDNALEMEELIEEVSNMQGVGEAHENATVEQRYLYLLDFSPLAPAKQTFEESMRLSEGAQAVLTNFRTLSNITAYAYKGWTTADAQNISGYLYTELEKFREYKVAFDALDTTGEYPNDKENVKRLWGRAVFEGWATLDTEMAALAEDAHYTGFTLTTVGVSGGTKSYASGEEALKWILEYGYKIKGPWTTATDPWQAGERDDTTAPDSADYENLMNSNNHWLVSFHMSFLLHKLEEAEVELPTLVGNLLNTIGYYNTNWATDFDYLYNVLSVVAELEADRSINYITEHMAEVVNTYMVNHNGFKEAGLAWNFTNGAFATKDFTYRNKIYKTYFGLSEGTDLIDYIKRITDIAQRRTEGLALTADKTGVTAPVTQGQPDPISQEAQAFLTKYNALPDIDNYHFIDWTTAEEVKTGYFEDEVNAAIELKGEYESLTPEQKTEVTTQLDKAENALFTTWEKAHAALEAAREAEGSVTMLKATKDHSAQPETFTAEQAIRDVIKWALKIKYGTYEDEDNDGGKIRDEYAETERVLSSNSHWVAGFHLVYAVRALEAQEIELPEYVQELLTAVNCVETDGFVKDATYLIDIYEQYARLHKLDVEGTTPFLDEALTAVVNKYVGWDNFHDGGLIWNWGNGGGGEQRPNAGENGRDTIYKNYFGTDMPTLHEALRYLGEIVKRDSENASGLNDCGLGFTAQVEAVEKPWEPELSEEAQAVKDAMDKIGKLDNNYAWLGWDTVGEENLKGYLYASAKYYRDQGVKAKYDTVDAPNKTLLHKLYTEEEITAWDTFATQLFALEASMAEKTFKLGNIDMDNTVTYTGLQAIEKAFEVLYSTQLAEKGFQSETGYFERSFHVLFLQKEFEKQEVDLPDALETLYSYRGSQDKRAGDFVSDFNAIYAIMTEVARIEKTNESDHAWLDETMENVVNTHLLNFRFNEEGFMWNCHSGSNGDDGNGDLRDTAHNYEIYFGATDKDSWKANVNVILDIVKRDRPETVLTANGLGVTAEVTKLDAKPDFSVPQEVQDVIEAFQGYFDPTQYDYKGWTASDTDHHGYLYSELSDFKTNVLPKYELVKNEPEKLAKLYAAVSETSIKAWVKMAEASDIPATIAEIEGLSEISEFSISSKPRKDDTTTLNGEQIFEEMLKYAYRLARGDEWTGEENDDANTAHTKVISGDNNWFVAIYIHLLKSKLDESHVDLPQFADDLLTQIGYEGFVEAYTELYGTVKLAQKIKDNTYTTFDDLADEDITFLNTYWTKDINGLIKWNWESGHQFEDYFSERVGKIVSLAGGTLTTDEDSQPFKMKDYIGVVKAFLEQNGCTVDASGWKVTDGTIAKSN